MSAVNLARTYRLTAGTIFARPAATKPEPPEDPVVPAPTGCKNLRAVITALTDRHGSQAALARHLGISPGVVSRMATAKPCDDRAFTIGRVSLETVARAVDKAATVDDLLAGRLLERASKGKA